MSSSRLTLLICAGLMLTGCASVSETIPTVEIVRKKHTAVSTVMAKYNKAHSVRQAEAPLVCDNPNMRKRAADNNHKNDMARVVIMEDNGNSNTVLADVKVNCKDYFDNMDQWSNMRTVSVTSTNTQAIESPSVIQNIPSQNNIVHEATKSYVTQAVSQTKAATKSYRIRSGDNLYQIARRHCTSFETLADINEIYDPSRISPGQLIKLPKSSC